MRQVIRTGFCAAPVPTCVSYGKRIGSREPERSNQHDRHLLANGNNRHRSHDDSYGHSLFYGHNHFYDTNHFDDFDGHDDIFNTDDLDGHDNIFNTDDFDNFDGHDNIFNTDDFDNFDNFDNFDGHDDFFGNVYASAENCYCYRDAAAAEQPGLHAPVS